MGLFTKKTKVKDMTPKEMKNARKYLDELINLFGPGQSPNFPLMQVAGLTPGQEKAQSQLPGAVATGGENYQLATEHYRDILEGDTDPRSGDYYQGLRDEMKMLRDESAADIRRRGQREGGTTQTSPTTMGQDESNRAWNSKILQLLGMLTERNIDRKTGAAGAMTRGGREEVDRIGAASQAGEAERMVEQQRNVAIYNQALQELLFPYTQQLQAIGVLNQAPVNIVKTGGGLTDLGFLVSAGSSAAGSYYGAKKA